MNKKPIFIVPAYAEIRFPYKRTVTPHERSIPLPGILTKSYAVKTWAYGKTKGKHDDRCTSPCASTTRKVLIILTLAFALAFLESPAQIIFGIEMTLTHYTWHQDATVYPAGIGTVFDIQLAHHFFSG